MDILIVEDDFISRNLIKKVVLSMGHQVVEAENGRQAWEIVQKGMIHFVISDWMMPEMDGVELCARVREQLAGQYVYLIMLTAKDSKKDLVHVLESGADDYIPKPFNPDELRARLQTGVRIIKLEESHRKLQQTLIESRNKLRIVFDSLQEEIVALDRDYMIVSANRSFVTAARCKTQDVINQCTLNMSASHPNLDICATDVEAMISCAFHKGQVQQATVTTLDEKARHVYKEVQCLPVKDHMNTVVQVVVVIKDVSDDKRKTKEIQALNKRLLETSAQIEMKNRKLEAALKRLEETQTQMLQSEKMASIGQLAAGVAHEINNPTGFVSSNLKTLSDYHQDMNALIDKYRKLITAIDKENAFAVLPAAIGAEKENIRGLEEKIDIDFLMADISDLINDCREGTERIKKIVVDLKDFAHPGEEKPQSIDINKGLESTLNVVNNELKYKATVHKTLGDVPTVLGYPQQLNQVFMNILVNAAQAIEKQGDIFITTRSADTVVEIIVSDTGCGIATENLSKIFDPFFTTKEVGKGTGLGMNIAYNIVKKHHGTIDVQSEVGKGTTFCIRIPAEIHS